MASVVSRDIPPSRWDVPVALAPPGARRQQVGEEEKCSCSSDTGLKLQQCPAEPSTAAGGLHPPRGEAARALAPASQCNSPKLRARSLWADGTDHPGSTKINHSQDVKTQDAPHGI